uniref:Uncharacterized protein n=1 Tax=Setaria italica TaxID=4555 RepID=K3ZB99_SETIT
MYYLVTCARGAAASAPTSDRARGIRSRGYVRCGGLLIHSGPILPLGHLRLLRAKKLDPAASTKKKGQLDQSRVRGCVHGPAAAPT